MRLKLIPFLMVLALAPVGVGAPVHAADEKGADDIVKALEPKVKFRGFHDPSSASSKNRAFIDEVTTRGNFRAITVEERKKVAKIIKKEKLPSIDITIFFDFNSARIREDSIKSVDALGKALGDKRLAGNSFMIAGHTDAKGSGAYNLGLSEARAKAVRDYLVANHKLDPEKLRVLGFGEEQLKNGDDPLAPENRRVQVTNLEK